LDSYSVITAAGQQIIGSAQPKYYGGITNTFRFKGLDLNVLFQYNIGNHIYNTSRSYTEGMSTTYSADVTVLNRWTPTNTNTDMPRAVLGAPKTNSRNSIRFLEDGSYGRFKSEY
jgi:hypothetical protein